MKLQETTLSQDYLYHGRVLQMHVDRVKLEDGRESTRECVDHPGGVSVAALTKDDEILLVRQYRYPYHEVLLEAPAGKMDHPGEDPLSACKREQAEETGTWSAAYISLGEIYPSPGYTNERLHLFACRVSGEGENHLDPGEFLEVERVPFSKALEMVDRNEIKDAKTQILILRTARLLLRKKL